MRLAVLAAAGSAALLLAAFGFQHLGGLAPCPICLWQRWPHVVAIGAGLALLPASRPVRTVLVALGGLAMLAGAGIGLYHTGIERGWWPGPTACSGDTGSLTGLSGGDLLSLDSATPLVRCDEVAWSLLGLSMASWNMLASLALAALWLYAARRLSAA